MITTLYDVETRALNQTVKRNIRRFPEDFMFQINESEGDMLVSQNVIPHRKYFGGSFPSSKDLILWQKGIKLALFATADRKLQAVIPKTLQDAYKDGI